MKKLLLLFFLLTACGNNAVEPTEPLMDETNEVSFAEPVGQLNRYRDWSVSSSSSSEESITKYFEAQATGKNDYHCANFLYGEDHQYLYSWVLCSDFSIVDNELVETPDLNGPARLNYTRTDGLQILSSEVPAEGENYDASLRALFPEKIYNTMQLTEDEMVELKEQLWSDPNKNLAIKKETDQGNEVMDSWDFEVPLSQNALMKMEDENGHSYLTFDPAYWAAVPGTNFSGFLSSNAKYIIYRDGFTLHEYHMDSGEDETLMTFFDTTASIDIKISPDALKVAAVAFNMEDESYRESSGTKLFLFTMDESGNQLKRDTYAVAINGTMSNEGLYSSSWYFYFNENNDFVYLSYSSDIDGDVKRTLDL
jgi:hypothetical protein